MSTPKENNFFSLENVLYSINSAVSKENLGDAVKRIREASGWSLAVVRKQSGYKLAISYINRIENNQIDANALSIAKTQALAKGLKVSEDFIFALARGVNLQKVKTGESLAQYFVELPENRKQDLLDIAKLFFQKEEPNINFVPGTVEADPPDGGTVNKNEKPITRKRRKAS